MKVWRLAWRNRIQSTLIYTMVTATTIDVALAEYWNHVTESRFQEASVNDTKDIDLVSKAKQLRKELSE